jgi:glycerol-3-phosphate O-acyltransferase
MEKISVAYHDRIKEMMRYAKLGLVVTEDNVRQDSNKDILRYIEGMIQDHLLPGSAIRNPENLMELFSLAKQGKSCLLLVEHYSNFDLPVFNYLAKTTVPGGEEIADNVIAIAGYKLNESNPVVTAFTEAFSRIVIAPSRTVGKLDREKDRDKVIRLNGINRAAMKALDKAKKEGKLILVFPAGTRFRPWEPETKRGVREIDSYIKSFDYMCLVSVNGMVLHIQEGKMEEDLIGDDKMIMTVSKPIVCTEFRDAVRAKLGEDVDKKQAVVDAIMEELDKMHEANKS